MAPRGAFYSVQQQLQLFGTQAEADAIARRPAERAPFETFCANPKSASVPKHDLYPVSQLVGEKKNMATQRILCEYGLHMRIEPIETAPHIHGRECHKNARCRRQTQHRVSLSSRARSRTGSSSRQRTVRPDGETISIAHALVRSFCRWCQHDFAEYHWNRQGRSSFRFCQPPVQSCQWDSILLGKCGARETTAPELLNHLQPLICGCSILPSGDCFIFHAASVSDLARRGRCTRLTAYGSLKSGSKLPHSESALRAQKVCGIRRSRRVHGIVRRFYKGEKGFA